MKKLMLVTAAAIASGAHAQSSVTLFGVIDAAVQSARADGVGHVTRLVNSSNTSSRLGVRGIEDLGGGLSASFWLEAAVNNDNGTGAATNTNNQAPAGGIPAAGSQGLTFNRRSTVSFAGRFGEIRLGRDYVPSFLSLPIFDPFGTNGVANSLPMTAVLGLTTGPQTAVRASNSIGYILPRELGGFHGQAMVRCGRKRLQYGLCNGRPACRPAPGLWNRPVQRGAGIRPDQARGG